jgi:hypothetical protein
MSEHNPRVTDNDKGEISISLATPTCDHDRSDQDIAIELDGMCPLCLHEAVKRAADEIDRLTPYVAALERIDRLERLVVDLCLGLWRKECPQHAMTGHESLVDTLSRVGEELAFQDEPYV